MPPTMARVLVYSPDGTTLHPGARIVAVALPTGYRRVWHGVVVPGDLCLDMERAQAGDGTRWLPIAPQFFTSAAYRFAGGQAQHYGCVIRRGAPVQDACRKCHVWPQMLEGPLCIECAGVNPATITE